MARPGREDAIVDPTAIGGQTFAVAPRVGWLCRAARLVAEPSPVTLDNMARRVGTNATRLHRLERGQLWDWHLISGYEQQLALTPGSLVAPARIAARYLPDRHRPVPDVQADVRATSILTERLMAAVSAGRPGSGVEWLRWADTLSRPNAVGLPESIAVDIIDGLCGELARSVGPAFPTRYEALSRLREGPYAYLVLEVARKRVGDPDVQILLDLMSALTESRADGVVRWCADLLADSRMPVLDGAFVGLDNLMGLDPTKRVLDPVLPDLVAAFHETPDGSPLRIRLGGLLSQVPPGPRADACRRLPGLPTPAQHAIVPTAHSELWWAGSDLAWQFTQTRGLREQPMLARLLHDAAFSPFEYISVPSFFLLGALPELRRWAADAIVRLIASDMPAHQQATAARRLAGARLGCFPTAATSWWSSSDRRLLAAAMLLAGQAGTPPPASAVRTLLDLDPNSVEVLFACAMTVGVEAIPSYLGIDVMPPELTRPARWFRREGRLVSDDLPESICTRARK